METRSDTRYDQIEAGWDVYGSDGEKIGSIEEVGRSYLLVVKGLIFTTDLYIPLNAVRELDTAEGRVYLNVAKDEVETRGWTEPPTDGETLADSGETYAETSSASGVGGYAADSTDDVAYRGSSERTMDTESVRVPVHQEELRAERTAEQAGEVRVGKNVVEEERALDVPVTRDEVQVRRVSVDREAGASEDAFTDGDTIRVPVTEERVNVTKEPRVVEELEISKRPVTETQRVSDTVRREEVDVDDTSGVLSGSSSSTSGMRRDFDDTTTRSGTYDTSDDVSGRRRDRDDRGEFGGEAVGGGAGALGGAALGGAVAGPPGAVVGGVVGAAGGAMAGEKAEGGDEEGGSGVGGGEGALGGAALGGAVAGPPGAVVGGAVGAGAGSGVGDQTEEEADDDINRR
jgi:uncharacterized protein (TIGR02271 family)